ncbi:MAG: 4-hydroxy-tetrahydrodipicolinate synthase [Hyphomonadaceae bacterium]|nr:4-hydroxy-tetrahydrodipicolinate synthase [Hyphomonadaceae bacterium]
MIKLQGSIPALVTPLRGGALDLEALQRLIAFQLEGGTHGLVACGTTGESPTLSDAEHARVIAAAVEAAGRTIVIAGCGAASTEHAIKLAKQAKAAGAGASLVVTPYYNRPSQAGLFAHFKAIAEAVDLPMLLYNVPARTSVDLLPETVAKLSRVANIVGVKDASRDLGRVAQHANECADGFILISGEDDTAVGFNAMGGQGCISVTANVAPRLCADLQNACLAGDYARARAINLTLAALHKAMFVEPSPAAPKYALSLLDICDAEVRAPLLPLSEAAQPVVRAAMSQAGLL